MRRRGMLLSTTILSGVVGGCLLAGSVAHGADLHPYLKAPPLPAFEPAVDAPNVKWEGLGGSISGKKIYGSAGSFTFPIQGSFGAQIDGSVGKLDGDTFGAVAGHWFWRNPSQALVGLYASYTNWDRFGGVNVGQVALEGEYYIGQFTVQGIAGVEFGNSVSNLQTAVLIVPVGGGGAIPGTSTLFAATQGFNVTTRFFDQINLKYYFTDNIDAYVGHRYLGGKNAAAFGGELALPLSHGVLGSAFVEARVGEADFHGIWGGVKFYFGAGDKPLIKRHRQQDPNNWTVDTLFSILNNQTSGSGSSTTQFCNSGDTLIGGRCERFGPGPS
jgi:hypothetical protein